MTVTFPFPYTNNAVGVVFSVLTPSQESSLINESTNMNYYDNVLAFYTMYYRSGFTAYLTYARHLADIWYTMPWIDKGMASQYGNTAVFPRKQALLGLMLRAEDCARTQQCATSTGAEYYWSGIRQYLRYDNGSFAKSSA